MTAPASQQAGLQAPAQVPVLMYHSICGQATRRFRRFAVDPGEFAAQLDYLAGHGYQALTAAELAARRASGQPLPARPVVLTFDDAYTDFAEAALPLLRARGFSASVYVPTAYAGATTRFNASMGEADRPVLSWAALADLLGEDVEVGSHSHSHPQLDLVSPAVVTDEVTRSARLIEDHLGVRAAGFCYPFGYWNKTARAAVAEAGFSYGLAVADLPATGGDDVLALPRLTVAAGIGVAGLARLLQAAPTRSRRGVSLARKVTSRAVRRVVPVLGARDAAAARPAG